MTKDKQIFSTKRIDSNSGNTSGLDSTVSNASTLFPDNAEKAQTWTLINETGTSIFLTGRAGTGKTHFLKVLKANSQKQIIVAAPTGIAAINAGGITLHSLFQLPFGIHIPGMEHHRVGNDSNKNEFKLKFSKQKRQLISNMDILVIDEISMVRADMLDAIDEVLRKYKNRFLPFGGVQLLMIGDLQQLPPVVTESEQSLMTQYYDTPYFFGSNALKNLDYLTIELQHIYRQEDPKFISLLNKVRNNRVDSSTLEQLNARFNPTFNPDDNEGYVRLVTHNRQADSLNRRKLQELPMTEHKYKAQIKDKFPSNAFPIDEELALKVGARVMFIKNDPSEDHAYYNGKLGRINHLGLSKVSVLCDGEKTPIDVGPLTWENTIYTVNKETGEIDEMVEGTFQQMPLRLAWAITIHKSQGLTFDKAMIDISGSFAHGQVYVALSRCRSLEGLILNSRLLPHNIITDDQVEAFTNNATAHQLTKSEIDARKLLYFAEQVNNQFDMSILSQRLQAYERIFEEFLAQSYPQKTRDLEVATAVFHEEVYNIAQRFANEYQPLCKRADEPQIKQLLQERIHSAARYFAPKLVQIAAILPKEIDLDNKLVKKRYNNRMDELQMTLIPMIETMKETANNGFDIKNFQRIRAKALLSVNSLSESKQKQSSSKNTTAYGKSETPDVKNENLYDALRKWRAKTAKTKGIPAYAVLQGKAMIAMANEQPNTLKELIAIPYFGSLGLKNYGQEIMAIIDEYRTKYSARIL
ncbi:MAG: HRDC domain-containing protein [Bacteroidaceae bacterium]